MKLYLEWVDKLVPLPIGYKTLEFAISCGKMTNQLSSTLADSPRSVVRETRTIP